MTRCIPLRRTVSLTTRLSDFTVKKTAPKGAVSVCRKNIFCPRSGLLKSVFFHGFPGAKNTSIRASVRFVGKADKPCARRGCSAEKSQRDFFDGLRPLRKERPFCMSDPEYLLFLRGEFLFGENPLIVKALVFPYLRDVVTGFVDDHLL